MPNAPDANLAYRCTAVGETESSAPKDAVQVAGNARNARDVAAAPPSKDRNAVLWS